jgi:Helix-turn-helix domain
MYDSRPQSNLAGNGSSNLDWEALIPIVINPTKVQIIEAMRWIDLPMSATELERVLDKTIGLSSLSYHVKSLAKWGVLRPVRKRKVRGAKETFYFFTASI